MDIDYFKLKRQMKRNREAKIRSDILNYAKRLAIDQYTTHYMLNFFQNQSEMQSVNQQDRQEAIKSACHSEYIKVLNRKYNHKNHNWGYRSFEIIMDYDFPIR